MTPRTRRLQVHGKSATEKVALEVAVNAGKQYRIKDLKFSGLSTSIPSTELREAADIQNAEVADGNEIAIAIGKIIALFKNKGKNVMVVPEMIFDDDASTVSLRFDIQQ